MKQCEIANPAIPAKTDLSRTAWLESLVVGDVVARQMPIIDSTMRGSYRAHEGVVVELNDRIIVCDFRVDTMRRMHFSRISGVSIYGYNFGWLVQ